ncbi:MAG: polymer-forming cytoskeletal protein [Acidobacteriaceae bacterium]|nr:polymer-forming cytoskeletal protein [Acidobacteriaceae bacterium]
MWSDRKPENPAATGNRADSPADLVRGGNVTTIGKAMTIQGNLTSQESLHIDGEFDGKLDLADHRLTVGPHARVNADTRARDVEVLGTLNGDIEAAKKVTIRKGGRLVGDLRTPAIVIEDGAYFKGRIEIVNTEQLQIVRPQVNAKTAAGD